MPRTARPVPPTGHHHADGVRHLAPTPEYLRVSRSRRRELSHDSAMTLIQVCAFVATDGRECPDAPLTAVLERRRDCGGFGASGVFQHEDHAFAGDPPAVDPGPLSSRAARRSSVPTRPAALAACCNRLAWTAAGARPPGS